MLNFPAEIRAAGAAEADEADEADDDAGAGADDDAGAEAEAEAEEEMKLPEGIFPILHIGIQLLKPTMRVRQKLKFRFLTTLQHGG